MTSAHLVRLSWTAQTLRRLRGGAVALAVTGLALTALTACSSPAPAVIAAPGVQPTPCGTVRIAVNPWVGYSANVAVVSYLARHELGCTVVTKNEPELTAWKRLASGEEDVILENWGHDDEKKRYIDRDKTVVEAGLTGNLGVIGWFVPPWMKLQYPDITNYTALNKYAHLFKTAQSGDKGQLLDGDPTYVTNDRSLVKNLGLDYRVVNGGSEAALIKAFKAAQKNKTPLLAYFYSPQWILSEINMAHISLPNYTPGCDADPATVKCDYQPYDLDKIMNKKFAYSGSPAADLVRNFRWTNNDQNQVARDMTDGGLSADQAAKKWLDGHREVWQKWLPAASTS